MYLGLGGCWAGADGIKEGVLLGGVIADDSVSKGKVQPRLVHLSVHHLGKEDNKGGSWVTHSFVSLPSMCCFLCALDCLSLYMV